MFYEKLVGTPNAGSFRQMQFHSEIYNRKPSVSTLVNDTDPRPQNQSNGVSPVRLRKLCRFADVAGIQR